MDGNRIEQLPTPTHIQITLCTLFYFIFLTSLSLIYFALIIEKVEFANHFFFLLEKEKKCRVKSTQMSHRYGIKLKDP